MKSGRLVTLRKCISEITILYTYTFINFLKINLLSISQIIQESKNILARIMVINILITMNVSVIVHYLIGPIKIFIEMFY